MDNLSDQQILDLIRSGRAETQAELRRITGMGSSTMSCILKRLRDRGLVHSAGTRVAGRGKPATVLRFAPPGHLLAIDIDGSQAEVGVLNFAGMMLEQTTVEMGSAPQPEASLRRLERAARRLVDRARVDWRDLRALGVNVNGYVSADGVLEFSTVLPWRKTPLARLAQDVFGLTVFCSDGRDRAVAEYRHGAGQGSEVMLYFNVADGVSARPVVNGQLFRGGHRRSGEIGHVVVSPNGAACGCGQRGCLEASISGPAIARRIAADLKRNAGQARVKQLLHLASSGRAAKTIDEVVRLADEQQWPYAQRLIDEIVSLAGKALASSAACFDPDCIVVDGYVFRDRPVLLRRLWLAAHACFKPAGTELAKLTPAMLGPRGKFLSLVTFVGDSLAHAGKLTG
ncbi:MAG: ROK family protein [Planctomycetia bacterium]|nr:ROK family protein [Planctomycetia bacterium]